MKTTVVRRRHATALLALALLTACSESGGSGGGGSEGALAEGPPGEDEVHLVKLEFEPEELTVDVGDEVTWAWTERLAHNVVANDKTFESDVLSTGTFTHTFTEAGEYPYECTLHPGMEGVIIVE